MSAPVTGDGSTSGRAVDFTIDELAAASGVPTRTIRFYQSVGALPKPQIRGRVAHYDAQHLERLRLILELQGRGLRIAAIRELLERIDRGELDLGEWLGLEAQLATPWGDDDAEVLGAAELDALMGGRRLALRKELLRLGLVERQGPSFLVKSPALLALALRLTEVGVDVATAAGSLGIIQKHAARTARELTSYFVNSAAEGFGAAVGAVELQAAFRVLRPTSQKALRLSFGKEMERALKEVVASGKLRGIANVKGPSPGEPT
jgi:DNA-binding transcriptional MerR regulator